MRKVPHSTCSVIPPHILRSLAEHGDDDAREHVASSVLTGRLWPTAGFQDFAVATVAMAGALYGAGGQVQTTIAEAWSAVGLPVPPSVMRRAVAGQIRPAARPLLRRQRREWLKAA